MLGWTIPLIFFTMNDVPAEYQTRAGRIRTRSFQEMEAAPLKELCRKHSNPKVGKSFLSLELFNPTYYMRWILNM